MARRLLATATAALLSLLVSAPPAFASWTWPLNGTVITSYRNGDDPYAAGQHRGVDIAGPVGTTVVAATAGLVRFSGTAGSSGLTVSVRTLDGRLDLSYLHLSALAVRAGQEVAAGTRIGAVGTTGRRSATQPHLHFGVRDAGSSHGYHDPLAFLPPGAPAPRTPRPVPVAVPAPVSLRPVPVAPGPRPVPAVRLRRPEPIRRPDPVSHPRLGPVPAPVLRALPQAAHVPDRAAAEPERPPGRTRRPLGSGAHPALGSAPRPEGLSAPRATPHAAPAGTRRHGPDVGWLAACAGALGVVLALATARLRPARRAPPGRRRRPASSIVRRCRTTSPRRSIT